MMDNIIKNKKGMYVFFTILWMVLIFAFSSQNGEVSNMNNTFIVDMLKKFGIDLTQMTQNIGFFIRKSAHFTEYFILGILLFKTYHLYLLKNYSFVSIITGFLYACSDEIHQHFVPGRAAALIDVLIDTAGVIAGVAIVLIIYQYKGKMAGMHRI